ncbi:DUF1801 domain-containing protein [Pseudonocardia sp.]|uniref:DUF1801 domain-containing protein n=1 Tax=Pseudonocardia sp. TaxID=60912 RepID=UPI003D0E51DB
MTGFLRFDGAVELDPAIDAWFARQRPTLAALAQPWWARMRGCGDDVRELLHDGVPTACLGDVPFAYVGAYTAHAAVGFFHGADLDDPAGLLEGRGRRMRHVKLRPDGVVAEAALAALVDAAYRHACGLVEDG